MSSMSDNWTCFWPSTNCCSRVWTGSMTCVAWRWSSEWGTWFAWDWKSDMLELLGALV